MTQQFAPSDNPELATKNRSITHVGDIVQLISLHHKYFMVKLEEGNELQTHRGVLRHDDMLGIPWGSKVSSHMGNLFQILEPSLADLIDNTKRTTQIMYPKEIGYAMIKMGIGPGKYVIEAGTGSGGLTTALAWAVGITGHVFTYEIREDVHDLAKKNLIKIGLDSNVTFHRHDILNGFFESGVDALFLDVQDPTIHLEEVRKALKPGGFFGSLQPTTNQVSRLIKALEDHNFSHIDVCEIMLRFYRISSERFRPVDRMIAHTGFLIFARPITPLSEINEKISS